MQPGDRWNWNWAGTRQTAGLSTGRIWVESVEGQGALCLALLCLQCKRIDPGFVTMKVHEFSRQSNKAKGSMSIRCSTPAPSDQVKAVENCPRCTQRGKAIGIETVKAMLDVSLKYICITNYYFCATEACPVVYFSGGGEQVFTVADVRERVHQKAPSDDSVFVCYCFRYTPKSSSGRR